MAKRNDRSVFPSGDGRWVQKRDDAERAGSIHETQRAAEDAARESLQRSGGGELTTHGRDGKIRSKDTIGGTDPCPPRDTEH